MERPFSTSKVTVEYFDPYGVYKLIAPGLISRLPLRHLHWQSHSGPLRSIDTLHVELVAAGINTSSTTSQSPALPNAKSSDGDATAAADDGFQTAPIGVQAGSSEITTSIAAALSSGKERRHQIPGLRRTPYLKVLLVRCDDNDSYKSQIRSEIREWVKQNTTQGGKKSSSMAENHDAFEWMIVHVVIPNSAAHAQPRTSRAGDGSTPDLTSKSTSRWGKSSSTLLEKLRSDFNSSSSNKSPVDRVAQIRVGINDVPYELLPRVVPAIPTGYVETEKDAQNAWVDLVDKFKTLILSSFDVRVSQYEEDIREKDVQRSLPGWNFCTFFILKEGLARGFESVGLVEDALVGYDELSVGLDAVIKDQQAAAGSAEVHGGALLTFTEDLKRLAVRALASAGQGDAGAGDEPVDLQADSSRTTVEQLGDIPISSTRKAYRDLILSNNVSLFDFRCYIFARQVSLLLRLGNAWSTREELLARLMEQQESVIQGVVPQTHPTEPAEESENLSMLAEICRRTLEFIPAVSLVMREDLLHAVSQVKGEAAKAQRNGSYEPVVIRVADNMVASFAFSIAQQILAQTSTKALPIPLSTTPTVDGHEPKASIPEPKTMMHPARSSSLQPRSPPAARGAPPSPGVFPGPQQQLKVPGADAESSQFLKVGLEELAARRADLYMLSRNILEKAGTKNGWADGWASAPIVGEQSQADMQEVDLEGDSTKAVGDAEGAAEAGSTNNSSGTGPDTGTAAGVENPLLRASLENKSNFYRLYELLTDKARHHYTVAGHTHSVHSSLADLAVLKYHLEEYASSASYFYETTPFFGKSGWSLLELSMLIMYARSLKELGRREEYAWRLLKLLTKAAEAERDRLEQQSSVHLGMIHKLNVLDLSAVRGYLSEMLLAMAEMTTEVRIPLTNFFKHAEVDGGPNYADGQDSFSITLRLHSLLADRLPVECVKIRMVQHSSSVQPREMWLQTKGPTDLKHGKSKVQLHSNAITSGLYKIDQIRISTGNLTIFHDETLSIPPGAGISILKEPHIVLYQRTSGLDVRLTTSKDLQLDKNNFLELELLTGWNDIEHCELRVRAATGGLRLITSEARIVNSSYTFSKPIEGGVVSFKAISAGTSLKLSFPFSIEQDVLDLCLKIEATYTTKDGTFTFAKAPSVSTSLALGVNVQDVFKHDALFSRFTVSTATISPLRVFRSELLDSEVFESHFGAASGRLPIVFPKQPVSLLYKIVRKPASTIDKHTKRTMYIKLYYSVLQDEIDNELQSALREAFRGEPTLYEFSSMVISRVLHHMHSVLSSYDLEKIALVAEISTMVIARVDWAKEFPGLGHDASGMEVAQKLALFLLEWHQKHPVIPIPQPDPELYETTRTILIPVDVPSITIVHTADIQLQDLAASSIPMATSSHGTKDSAVLKSFNTPMFCINQLLPATLHLKWTRLWDTGDPESMGGHGGYNAAGVFEPEDLEFSFEVTAPTDTWLVGGRRKGHFIIPSPDAGAGLGWKSTPDCEATIPLILIPLREGWLPYPSVEIREVVPDNQDGTLLPASGPGAPNQNATGEGLNAHSQHHCETDYRNLGETVHVVADRSRVTLSLDASGPGGGPLLLESDRVHIDGRVVV